MPPQQRGRDHGRGAHTIRPMPSAPAPGAETTTSLVTRGYLVLLAGAVAFFVSGGVVLPVASRYARDVLGADELGVGLAIGSFSIAALALRPLVGWSADRFGRRPLLLVGSLLNVASLVLHLAAFSLPVFVAARALLGAAEAFYLVAFIAAVADLAPPARRGESLSYGSLTLYLGVAFGPWIGETVLGLSSYAWVWLVGGGIGLVAIALWRLAPETKPAETPAADHAGVNPNQLPGRASRLIHPAGIEPGLISFLGLVGMAAFFTFLPLYGDQAGMDGVALPFLAYAVVVIALRIVGATWPDRFGAVRVSGAALGIGGAGLAIFALLPTAPGLVVGTLVFATGVAFLVPALLSVAVARVPTDERGRVVGTASVFWDLSLGVGPVVLGVAASAGGYGAAFALAAVASITGLTLLLLRRRSLMAPVEPVPVPAVGLIADRG